MLVEEKIVKVLEEEKVMKVLEEHATEQGNVKSFHLFICPPEWHGRL